MFSMINRKVKRMVIRHYRQRPQVLLSDTTLRDGAQMPGVRLTPELRARIAAALGDAGLHSIDLGFPAAGAAEVEAIKLSAKAVKGPVLSVLARTLQEDVDLAGEVLAEVSPLKRAVTLFVGTSPTHREHKHSMTRTEVIDQTTRAIERAQKYFEIISFGAEDASRTEPEFLAEVYSKAIAAGATSIGFTDTVGILTPAKVTDALHRIQDSVANLQDALLGVHFHNDLGLATANSLAAVEAGANIVQGTVNGIGERAGNTALEEVVLALTLHKDEFKRDMTARPETMWRLARLVAEATGSEPAANKPVVGRNVFRTEAGIHQDGLLKHPDTYLPYRPEVVGAGPVELVLGRHSGSSAVRHHLESSGLEPTAEHVRLVLGYLKGEEHSPEEMEEISGFLERLKPFMTQQEEPAKDSRRNGRHRGA